MHSALTKKASLIYSPFTLCTLVEQLVADTMVPDKILTDKLWPDKVSDKKLPEKVLPCSYLLGMGQAKQWMCVA